MHDSDIPMDVCQHFDPLPIAAMENPFPLLSQLRERCPVAHSDEHGGFWVLSRAADVASVAEDHRRFSSNKRGNSIPRAHGFEASLIPIEIDPPLHQQYRDPIRDRFTPRAVHLRRDEIHEVTTRLIDGFIERGKADLASELAMPLPGVVATRVLGLPEEDRDLFRDWAVRALKATGDPEVQAETYGYFNQVYDDRVASPRDDIPSVIVSMQIDGRTMTREEFLIMMTMLFVAGLDTTAHASAQLLVILAQHDDLRAALIAEPSLIPQAVEELLRYITPLPQLSRTAVAPVEVGGTAIPEDDRVMLNWLAANHDPAQFADPDSIRLDRPAERHFAFGHGIHKCLGQHLARLELRVLIEEVLGRIPDYRLDPDDPPKRYGGVTRGISSLPVLFTPGARRSAEHAGETVSQAI